MNFTQFHSPPTLPLQTERKIKTMADKNLKNPLNVAGTFYVDVSCIDCDQCRNALPNAFVRDDEAGLTYVTRQPSTLEEIAAAQEALQGCPSDSIGNDGAV